MSDEELLELAAKAAGIVIVSPVDRCIVQPLPQYADGFIVENTIGGHSPWNPLGDDGDALRLAVKLRIDILTEDDDKQAGTIMPNGGNGPWVAYTENSYAAVRRAIVGAAAEIGRDTP